MATSQTSGQTDIDIDEDEFVMAALAAPFADARVREGKGGRSFKYINSSMAMNRLDDVVGPHNWEVRFRVIDSAVSCEIAITLPSGRTLTRGGMSGYDADPSKTNSTQKKSAVSDAFKVAARAFGIGRYLKESGMPNFYRKHAARIRALLGADRPPAAEPVRSERSGPAEPPRREESPSRPPARGQADIAGRDLYRKYSGDRDAIDRLNDYGKKHGYPSMMIRWGENQCRQAEEAVMHVVDE
jgi:hypothetical protein